MFSNFQLGFPHEPLQFGEIKLQDGKSPYWNGFIAIDEWNFFFDCRKPQANVEHSAFLLQQKKQGCILAGTTHDLLSLDLRLRNNYDYLILPEVFPKHPQPPQIIRMEIRNGPKQAYFNKTITLDARPFLGLYDTFAVYDPFKKAPVEKATRRDVKL